MLNIKYNNIVINKQYLTPNETKMQPIIEYNFENNKLYTLLMYDPDTPHGDYIHWTIVNIKNNIKNGNTLISYKGPSPPKNTGIHRYIFLLFEQDKLLDEMKMKNIMKLERNIVLIELLNKLNIFNKEITSQYFTSQYQNGSYQTCNKKKQLNKFNKSIKAKKQKKSNKYKNRSYKKFM
jgi:phosphatidylethanolamine-binding protein (PEBP) family uncharacterized protein